MGRTTGFDPFVGSNLGLTYSKPYRRSPNSAMLMVGHIKPSGLDVFVALTTTAVSSHRHARGRRGREAKIFRQYSRAGADAGAAAMPSVKLVFSISIRFKKFTGAAPHSKPRNRKARKRPAAGDSLSARVTYPFVFALGKPSHLTTRGDMTSAHLHRIVVPESGDVGPGRKHPVPDIVYLVGCLPDRNRSESFESTYEK
ncbi:hypothetical protein EVAR_85445_1 [Eumeta japonica]|uniref:Uncharacterized protein n=1 Tax=Eumeta variegata TaxID=151549 RepID=A0A4C1WL57_EUMVA|nr:hypothetical protein EVAR_85445_1 [Eumeta japonica]